MMCQPLRKHNLSSIFLLALKYTSVSYISCNEIENLAYKCFIKNNRVPFKNNSTFNHCASELPSVGNLHKKWSMIFDANSVPESDLSIRYIIEHVLGIRKAYQYDLNLNTKITEEQEKEIGRLCECRLARMPVQYIIKEWDFRELRLAMQPPVFIPRPETEQLVDLVVEAAPQNPVILEVGCGSGAICLSLLKAMPNTQMVAIDQSGLACRLTANNARLNNLTTNLQVVHSKLKEDGTLSQGLPVQQVDVLVSNPPYIPSPQLSDLQPEIKLYEDLRALEGGRDGLRVVRALLLLANTILKPGGLIFLEVDSSHPKLIAKLLTEHPEMNIKFLKTYKDFCDVERFVKLERL